MARPASRLGKGLSAIIPPRTDRLSEQGSPVPGLAHADSATGHHAIRDIPIDQIEPNPRQPRTTFHDDTIRELADSIRSTGLLQPIIVRASDNDRFQLVAGERRLRAARLAGLQSIPAVVRDFSDRQSFEVTLIENLQRDDLAPLERAAAYQHYLNEFGGSIEDLALRLGESRANVSNYIRLLKLGPEICFMLGGGQLGMGQARAIAGIGDTQRQLAIARLAARRNLSVRQVEELARTAQSVPSDQPKPVDSPAADARRRHLHDVEETFERAIGFRVRVVPGKAKNTGRVIIWYTNLEEFDRLADRLGANTRLE